MKPVYLSFENLKGRDGQYDLRPVNIWTGPNGIGKSTVLWAVEIALLGYHPTLGKQNQATASLIGGQRMDMNVCLRFDNGTANQISWAQKSDGEIKKTASLEHDDIPAVMFDLRSYLGLTKKDRIKMVSDRISQDDIKFDEQSLIDRLKKIEVVPAAECVKAISELIAFTEKSIKTRTRSKQSILDWLSSFVKELDEAKKRHAILRDQASSQMIGLRQSGSSPKSQDEKLRELYELREKAQSRLNELMALQKQISQTSLRKTSLQAVIDLAVPDVSESEKFLTELRAEVEAWKDPMPAIEAEISIKSEAAKRINSDLYDVNAAMKELNEKLSALSTHQKCPYCKSNRQGWKVESENELKELISLKETEAQQLKEKYAAIITEGKALRQKQEEARAQAQTITSKKLRISELEKTIGNAAALKSRRAQAEAELKGITESAGTVDPIEIEKLNIELDRIKNELIPLEANEQAVKQSIANRELSQKLERTLISEQTLEEVFKLASAEIIKEQERIVEDGFSTILALARKFTDDILPGQLMYRDGDLGMMTEAGWVAHEVMGTTHQTLAYIGVSIALAQQSPTKIVILDEAGIIHPHLKPAIVERMLSLHHQGIIDSVFMTDPTNVGYEKFKDHKDFQLIELA